MKLSDLYVYLFFISLYLPILWILFLSFFDVENEIFTFSLYSDLFNNKEILIAVANSFFLAISSSFIAVLLGTSGAIGTFFLKYDYVKIIESIVKMQMANVEIVIALSLSIMFIFFKISSFSFFTLLIGHICLSLPFIYFFIKPKLIKFDLNLYEESLDLGCTPIKAIRKVILPHIFYDILSSFMFSVMLSLDDFVITFFLRGPGLFSGFRNIETISTFAQSKIKKSPIPPELKALTGIYFLFSLICVIIFFLIKRNKRNNHVKS
ncbi:MAG: ABC transporter permease subunit [Bacilli bacterium]|nr:ABC transporter permease subunit [Bacilli bacterium]